MRRKSWKKVLWGIPFLFNFWHFLFLHSFQNPNKIFVNPIKAMKASFLREWQGFPSTMKWASGVFDNFDCSRLIILNSYTFVSKILHDNWNKISLEIWLLWEENFDLGYFFSPRFSILRMRIAMITVKLFSNPCFSLKRQICVSFYNSFYTRRVRYVSCEMLGLSKF